MQHKISAINSEQNQSRLADDLQAYYNKALELGATKAKILRTEEIMVDERVTLKCQVPRCFGYGTGANCPPHTLKPDEMRVLLKKYTQAIFFVKQVPSSVIVRDKTTIKERVRAYQDVFKIVTDIEAMAFYDGHYLAFGLGAGSCRHTYCGLEPNCAALQGEKCRFSLRSRPSMEAVGLDVYKMAARAGWEMYPIGSNAKPEEIPFGLLAGIVVIE